MGSSASAPQPNDDDGADDGGKIEHERGGEQPQDDPKMESNESPSARDAR